MPPPAPGPGPHREPAVGLGGPRAQGGPRAVAGLPGRHPWPRRSRARRRSGPSAARRSPWRRPARSAGRARRGGRPARRPGRGRRRSVAVPPTPTTSRPRRRSRPPRAAAPDAVRRRARAGRGPRVDEVQADGLGRLDVRRARRAQHPGRHRVAERPAHRDDAGLAPPEGGRQHVEEPGPPSESGSRSTSSYGALRAQPSAIASRGLGGAPAPPRTGPAPRGSSPPHPPAPRRPPRPRDHEGFCTHLRTRTFMITRV